MPYNLCQRRFFADFRDEEKTEKIDSQQQKNDLEVLTRLIASRPKNDEAIQTLSDAI